ncbi:MAG: hypothetical protein GJ676_03990 [Rhodobacteraceae bacterium]|nr:hypothetical protein [Paracoccaceae bacterium]
MAVEVLTISLEEDEDKVKGKDLIAGDENDNQIVTVLDGGDLEDEGGVYVFEFWGKGTPTEPGAGPGGDDEFYFDLSGFDDDFHIEVKSFDERDCFIFTNFDSYSVVNDVYTFQYTGSDGQPHTVSIDAVSQNGTGTVCVVVCFARGTRIRTRGGEKLIEGLKAGDQVLCTDGVLRDIKWIGSRVVPKPELAAHPELKPVRLSRNALAKDKADADLVLSPQHRILLSDWRAELLFGEEEVLVSAQSMINDQTIRPADDLEEVEYFHILLDGHHTVFANGLECETLMPAEMAQHALSAEERSEILTIFPELAHDLSSFGTTCRMTLKPHEVRAMLGS